MSYWELLWDRREGLLNRGKFAVFYTRIPFSGRFVINRDLDYRHGIVFRGQRGKALGNSVRCVRNE